MNKHPLEGAGYGIYGHFVAVCDSRISGFSAVRPLVSWTCIEGFAAVSHWLWQGSFIGLVSFSMVYLLVYLYKFIWLFADFFVETPL